MCTLALLAGTAVALAAPDSGAATRTPAPRQFGRMYGVVPAARDAGRRPHRPTASEFAGTRFASGSNLINHGGPVMQTNTTYAIYWEPASSTVSPLYNSLLNRFFTDVGVASGSTSNVYSTDTQYSAIQYRSSFAGSYVDTTPIPDHCSGEYSGTGATVSGCVLDSDIQAAVLRAIAANGWTAGPTSMFFVFTPRNVGSCFDSTSRTCAYTYYCAYHSSFSSNGTDVIYANQPYTDTSGVGLPGACDVGQHPNGDQADATISVVSHEHNEAITDPNGNAWYDSSGNEIGDKCAWNFGSSLGSTSTGLYNQVINGDRYYMQQEWSNASSSCVQSYTPPGSPPTVTGLSPAAGTAGTPVIITGTNLTGATNVSFNGAAASFTVSSPTSISATVPATATTGAVTVTTAGGTGSSATAFTVRPSISGFSPASGPVGSAVTISGSGLAGATSVTFNGVSASFTATSSTSISTTVPATATSGAITVVTPAGSATSATSFVVTVNADFTLTFVPSSRTVSRGSSTTYAVTVNPVNGFSGSVTFAVAGLPGRTTASFSPNPATGATTLKVSTNSRTTRGTYTLTVTATAGALKHTYQLTLVVQ